MSARAVRPRKKPLTGAERRQAIIDELGEDDTVMFFDGFDEAIGGLTAHQPGRPAVVYYDFDRLVRCCRQQGMTEDEAIEYLEYNTIGAWVGEQTPVVVRVLRPIR